MPSGPTPPQPPSPEKRLSFGDESIELDWEANKLTKVDDMSVTVKVGDDEVGKAMLYLDYQNPKAVKITADLRE